MKIASFYTSLFYCSLAGMLQIAAAAGAEQVIRFDSGGRDLSHSVAIAPDGDVIVGGEIENSASETEFAIVNHGPAGGFEWRATLLTPEENAGGAALAIDFDDNSNIYAGGTLFRDTGALRFVNDLVVASFTSSGAQRWVDIVQGAADNAARITRVHENGAGAVFASGVFESGWLTTKYDANGAVLWRSSLEPGTGAIAVDQVPLDDGGVAVLGDTVQSDNENIRDATLVRYSADGSVLWRRDFSNLAASIERAADLTMDDAGNFYVTGITAENIESTHFPFLLRFSGQGDLTLVIIGGEAGGEAITIAPDGAIVTAGAVINDGGTNTSSISKLSSSGSIVWTREVADGGVIRGELDTSADGDVLFGGGVFKSSHDFFAARLSAQGDVLLESRIADTHVADDVAFTGAGAILITGAERSTRSDSDFFTVLIDEDAAPPLTAPAAPSDLSANAKGRRIDLRWTDNADNESGFEIERAEDGGAFATLGEVGADVTSFSDRNVQAGIAYSYRVRAFNAAGASSFSNTASAMLSNKGGGKGKKN